MAACGYCHADIPGHRPYSKAKDGVPSVTTVTGLVNDGKARSFAWAAAGVAAHTANHKAFDHGTHGDCDPDLKQWCDRCAHARAAFDRDWNRKADLGSHVHHLALDWAQGRDITSDRTVDPYLDALTGFYEHADPDYQLLEATVLYDEPRSHAYRGSLDMVATVTWPDGTRCRSLLDVKTGALRPVEQTLQLAGYRHAKHVTDWSDGAEKKVGRMPAVQRTGVLLLAADGTHQLIELPAGGEAHSTFLRLVNLYRWCRQMRKWDHDRQPQQQLNLGDAAA